MHDSVSKLSRPWRADFPFAPERVPLFYGWVIVFAATVGILFSIPGQTMGFSVFTEMLMAELGLSRVALSTAYCAGTVASGLTLPHLGVLLDRWGERKMVVFSALVTGLVLLYLSLCARISQGLSAGLPEAARPVVSFVLIGVGFYLIRAAAQGVLTMTCRNVMGKWFNQQRGLALGASGVVVAFGFSSAPRFLDLLIGRFGYEGAWLVLGLTTIGFMAPFGWLLFRNDPESSGLVMDGREARDPADEHPDMRIHRPYSRAEALATPAFWVFNLSFAWVGLFSTAFTFHIVSLGEEFGLTRTVILTLFMPIAVASVCTNLFFGWISSRVRLKYLLMVMNLGGLMGACGLISLNTVGGTAAYVVGNGLASGGFVNLLGNAYPRFFGRVHLGAISGVSMSTIVMASGVGPLLFGLSAQFAGSYRPALIGSIAVPALLALFSLRANNPQLKEAPAGTSGNSSRS